MPLHVWPRVEEEAVPDPTLSRRDFLERVAALGVLGGVGPALLGSRGAAALGNRRIDDDGPRTIALLADTHIAAADETVHRGNSMSANLRRVLAEVREALPASLIVNGDLAQVSGERSEYERFVAHFEPLFTAGPSLHFVLGNHDHRERFLEGVKAASARDAVAEKYAGELRMHGLRWVFLDSLEVVNAAPGSLGPAQLAWLAKSLDADAMLPTVVFVHHNPEVLASGLKDSREFLEVVIPRRQVKAVFFGHTHTYRRWEVEGLHLVNLPAVAYPFVGTEPLGWVFAGLREDGMDLELRSLDAAHARHGEKTALGWRSGQPLRVRI
jgi:3',5'-cyclic AMP phosphodiesterase CpdA